MKRNIVRYKVKPELADENARLIKDVFAELHAKAPKDVRYVALRLPDGSFIHFSITDGDVSPIPRLDSHQGFTSTIKERLLEGPQQTDVVVVGNYRMLSE